MDTGGQSVKTVGICWTRQLFVECWDSPGPGQLAAALKIPGTLVRFG